MAPVVRAVEVREGEEVGGLDVEDVGAGVVLEIAADDVVAVGDAGAVRRGGREEEACGLDAARRDDDGPGLQRARAAFGRFQGDVVDPGARFVRHEAGGGGVEEDGDVWRRLQFCAVEGGEILAVREP